MNCYPCQCKEDIRSHALQCGAVACGFACAGPVDATAREAYDKWVAAGCHGTMEYCSRHSDVRRDPRLLLDGARTVISCAFNYWQPQPAYPLAQHVACYAWGNDYHWVLKQRLGQLATYIKEHYGGETRVCVDTAPIRERYWAQQAGVGFVGVHNQLIVPGVGAGVFLGEVLWTGEIDPDAPMRRVCDGCMACVGACPGAALDGKGGCDARRCLSYITIEQRRDRSDDAPALPSGAKAYGCDVCLQVCPHNAGHPPTEIDEFAPDAELLSLTSADLRGVTPSHFRRRTRHSAMQRITLHRLIANLESVGAMPQ